MPRHSRGRKSVRCTALGPAPRLILPGGFGSAPRAPPAERGGGSGVGTGGSARRAGLSCSGCFSGPSPSLLRLLLLQGPQTAEDQRAPAPEPGDQLRKVAASICGNVSLIRPPVRCKSGALGAGGAGGERRGGWKNREGRANRPSWCRVSDLRGGAPAG